jgi:hypothetical protein
MNFPSSDIGKYINRPELIRQTAEQVIKDFDLFGLKVTFSGNPYEAYEELFEEVLPHIEQLIKSDQQKFLSILYRIDLSEDQIRKGVKEQGNESFAAVVTDLILKRELWKVVLRNHFKA